MRLFQSLLALFFLVNINYAQSNVTSINGSVKNWPTDSIYLLTMPFYSPHSSEVVVRPISGQDSFQFDFQNKSQPFIVQMFPTREQVDFNREQILYNNLSDEYYIRSCVKFYTYRKTTLLIEPQKTLKVDLTYNSNLIKLDAEKATRLKKSGINVADDNTVINERQMGIEFKGDDAIQNEYYQNSFELDKTVDLRLKIYENMPLERAIEGYHKILTKQLADLEIQKEELSPLFYQYIKTEIVYGAKYQFLRFLMLDRSEDEMNNYFTTEFPKDVLEILAFDKTSLSKNSLISEEYNNYVEIYLNFYVSIMNKEHTLHAGFDFPKIRTAIQTLPHEHVYYYLANNLLQTDRKTLMDVLQNEEAVEELITKTITKYPDGELNEKLILRYDL